MLPKHMPKTLTICLAAALLVGITLPVPPARPASPDTFTVCATGCDFTTIQAALDDDRVSAEATIQVVDAVHTEAGITVRQDVTIQGQGAARTIVQAHAEVEKARGRVFLVEEGATAVIQDVTIRHGKPGADEHGGGIMNRGTLTLQRCVVTHNVAGGGAGICNDGALTLVDCTVSDNVAQERGVPSSPACGSGGGIRSGKGTLALINCTISGNQAGVRSKGTGGGIRVGCKCTATFTNTTVSGNQAARQGGGLLVVGPLRLVNCTISENTSREQGSGVYVQGQLDLVNTIIANNATKNKDCVIGTNQYGTKGTLGTNVNSLVGDGSCDAAYSGDPMLGPLADNGGATWTHALLPGSPAIDVVPAGECPVTTDQRGLPRPVACTSPDTPGDLGAFEVQTSECITPSPNPTREPPTPTATPARATPTPVPVPAPPNDLLPAWGLLGGLVLALGGLVIILWLWRRRL